MWSVGPRAGSVLARVQGAWCTVRGVGCPEHSWKCCSGQSSGLQMEAQGSLKVALALLRGNGISEGVGPRRDGSAYRETGRLLEFSMAGAEEEGPK